MVNDMLGMFNDFTPKFVKQYANVNEIINEAIHNYINEVKNIVITSYSIHYTKLYDRAWRQIGAFRTGISTYFGGLKLI